MNIELALVLFKVHFTALALHYKNGDSVLNFEGLLYFYKYN